MNVLACKYSNEMMILPKKKKKFDYIIFAVVEKDSMHPQGLMYEISMPKPHVALDAWYDGIVSECPIVSLVPYKTLNYHLTNS